MINNIDIHDKVNEAYYGLLGPNFMRSTQQRIHWIGKRVKGKNILDIGCSQGILSILLAREGKQLVSIDISECSIKEANEYLIKEEKKVQEKVEFLQADYINYTVTEKFETIILSEVLEHLMNPEPFIEKAKNDLVENGTLIISVPFGINDFIDHKQTYYFIDMFETLSNYFYIEEFEILGKWIGYVCKNTNVKMNEQIKIQDLKYFEKSLYNLERNYLSSIDDLNNKKKSLDQEISLLKSKKNDLEENLQKCTTNYLGMESRFKKVTIEKENLEKTINEFQIKIKFHEEKESNNLNEIQRLDSELQKLESQKEQWNNTEAEQNKEIIQLQSQKERLESELQKYEEKLQKLESQKEQWNDTEAEQNKEIIQLQSQKERLESELQKYEEKLQKLESQKEQWNNTEAEQNKEIIQLQSQKERLESELQKYEEKLQKLESQKEQWNDTEAEQNKEIIQLQSQKERLESEIQKYEEKLQKLESQKEQWNDTEAEQNKEIIQLQSQKERLESEIQKYEEKLQKLESQKEQWNDTEAEQNKEIIQLQRQKERLESELQKYEEQLEKQRINYIGMQERYKNKLDKEEILLLENKVLKNQKDKYKTNFDGMDTRNKRLSFQLEKKDLEIENLKNTLSFRWGTRLVRATKSFSTFVTLPYGLYEDYKTFKKKRKNNLKNTDPKINKSEKITDLQNLQNLPILKKLKVAAIMDEFTYNSFKYECNLLQITPENWQGELSTFKPDLVFIESAWKGKDDLWATKISNCATELVEMVQYCHNNNIKTMFWNKEDPVHFDTFIPVAKMVDYVFTTDIDCVPRYKEKVGHDNVQFLPFAAQPAVHNPIELFDRKDAFNFAGSYYLRYPERQKDFASLIDAVKKFKPVEIYDRNFDNPHPHYTFPDEYKPMILGKLPFTEIDKAYKGYRFGINMNTIKQSQSMFARRVFELLASNTVVVSNFSRGVRLLFGDLVVSSDNQNQLSTMLEKYCTDELSYKKLRLLGLRKVMQEHTYAQRLSFISSKVFGTSFNNTQEKVILFVVANSNGEVSNILESFKKQTYTNKILCIIKKFKDNIKEEENIYIFDKAEDAISEIMSLKSDITFVGQLNPSDYYGENYLTDIILSTRYSDADAFGKVAYYEFDSKIELKNDKKQYYKTNHLEITSSLVKINKLHENIIKRFIDGSIQLSLENMLSIDEFNYCKNGLQASKEELENYVDDLKLVDKGLSFENKLSKIADTLPATISKSKDVSTLPTVSAEQLYKLLPTPASAKVKLSFSNSILQIDTKLGAGVHTYIYAKKQFTREELNLVLNSQFELQCDCDIEDIRTVFEFQDKDGQKISHSMNKAGEHHALAIPNECKYIRFGLKLVGNGRVKISKLVLGTHGEVPFAIVGKSKKLVLTKQYPSYDDIYKYGFLHSRIRAYKQEGVLVDIFRINNQPQTPYREFEDIDVATGDNELLEQTLKTGQYDHVLVHLIDENMWKVLEKFIDKIKVTIWVHGAEIQVWQQRDFEFVNMDQKEIDRQKRLSNKRVVFWNYLVSKNYKNLHFVFVSDWLLKSSEIYLKLKFNPEVYSIIHNNIDSKIFDYKEKVESDRFNILSIRPYAKRVYANDLIVKAIEILSKKDFFEHLIFTIIGEGELWEETITPLKKYSNVTLLNKFLQHNEISQYHKQNGILLVPTRMDTQGVSRDEAMSSGLVPITTNVAAIPEFVDNNCGIVVAPENPLALADAIEFLYKKPEKFLNLSLNANQRVRKQCGFEKTIVKELRLING